MKTIRKTLYAAALVLLTACTDIREAGFTGLYNSETTPMSVSLTGDGAIFGSEELDTEVSFDANFWWDVQVSFPGAQWETSWLILGESSAFGTQPVPMKLLRNVSKSDRTATLTFTSQDDPSFQQTVTITQKASEPFIDLDTSPVSANLLGQQIDLTLSTSENWEVIVPPADQGWLSSAPAQGTLCRDMAFTITAGLNDSGDDRSSTITVRSVEDNSLQKTITVAQVGTYEATELTVTNGETFIASFPPKAGIVYYMLNVVKDGETDPYVSVRIDADNRTEDYACDLTAINYGAYVGAVTFNVAAHMASATFKKSNDVASNSHFDSGLGSTSSPFVIKAMRHFNNVSRALDKAYHQQVDLDFEQKTGYVPIGATSSTPFTGVYDAGIYSGATLTGVNSVRNLLVAAANSANAFGMFGYVNGGTVKNLSVITSTLTVSAAPPTNQADGLLVGMLLTGGRVDRCSLTNCNVTINNSTALNSTNGLGGMIGMTNSTVAGDVNNVVVSNCTVVGGEVHYGNKACQGVGGIVGYNGLPGQNGTCVIEYCVNESMNVTMEGTGAGDVGGISGQNWETIRYCHNKAAVTGRTYVGGITSGWRTTAPTAKFVIEYCRNSGTVTLTGTGTGTSSAGGISGRINAAGVVVQQCYNTGNVVCTDLTQTLTFGGITGNMGAASILNCYNTGTITGSSTLCTAGGISPTVVAGGTVANCYSTGTLTGTFKANGTGAITTTNAGTVTDCYYLTGLPAGPGGVGTALSSTAINEQASYANWDFTTPIWRISEGVSPPTLVNNPY
ncbi:hypothetical protein FACS1894159_04640 [Bacteroidia bacterium]|nr:hypothetical protein FACS1894159_04640 [Bacteroidia bacterium]